jgi:hypothetical protein
MGDTLFVRLWRRNRTVRKKGNGKLTQIHSELK